MLRRMDKRRENEKETRYKILAAIMVLIALSVTIIGAAIFLKNVG